MKTSGNVEREHYYNRDSARRFLERSDANTKQWAVGSSDTIHEWTRNNTKSLLVRFVSLRGPYLNCPLVTDH